MNLFINAEGGLTCEQGKNSQQVQLPLTRASQEFTFQDDHKIYLRLDRDGRVLVDGRGGIERSFSGMLQWLSLRGPSGNNYYAFMYPKRSVCPMLVAATGRAHYEIPSYLQKPELVGIFPGLAGDVTDRIKSAGLICSSIGSLPVNSLTNRQKLVEGDYLVLLSSAILLRTEENLTNEQALRRCEEIGSGLGFTEDELEKLKWIVRQYLSLGELQTLSKAQRCSIYTDPNWKLLESLLLGEYFAIHLPNSPVTERWSHRDICEDKLILDRWRERNLARAKFKAKLLKKMKELGIEDYELWSEALSVALTDVRKFGNASEGRAQFVDSTFMSRALYFACGYARAKANPKVAP